MTPRGGHGSGSTIILLAALVAPTDVDAAQDSYVANGFVYPPSCGEDENAPGSSHNSNESSPQSDVDWDPRSFPEVSGNEERFGTLRENQTPREYLIGQLELYLEADRLDTLYTWTRSMPPEIDPFILSRLRIFAAKDIRLPIALEALLSEDEAKSNMLWDMSRDEPTLSTLKLAFSPRPQDQQRLEIALRLMPEQDRLELLKHIFKVTTVGIATPKELLAISQLEGKKRLVLLEWLAERGFYFPHAISPEEVDELQDKVYRRLLVDRKIEQVNTLIGSLSRSSSGSQHGDRLVPTRDFGVIGKVSATNRLDAQENAKRNLVVPLIEGDDAKVPWPQITGITTTTALNLQAVIDSRSSTALDLCHLELRIRLRGALQGFVNGEVSRGELIEELLHLRPAIKLAEGSVTSLNGVDAIITTLASGPSEQAIGDVIRGGQTLAILEVLLSDDDKGARLRCAILANSGPLIADFVYQAIRSRSAGEVPKSPDEALQEVVSGGQNSDLWLRLPDHQTSCLEVGYPDLLAAKNVAPDTIIKYATLLSRIPKGALTHRRITDDLESLVRLVTRSLEAHDDRTALTQLQARELIKQVCRAIERAWDHKVISVKDFPKGLRGALLTLAKREQTTQVLGSELIGFVAAFEATGRTPLEVQRIFAAVDHLQLSHLALFVSILQPANNLEACDYVETLLELFGRIRRNLDFNELSAQGDIAQIAQFMIQCYRDPITGEPTDKRTREVALPQAKKISTTNAQVANFLLTVINATTSSAGGNPGALGAFGPLEMQRAAKALIELPVLPSSPGSEESAELWRREQALRFFLGHVGDVDWFKRIGRQLPLDTRVWWIRAGAGCDDNSCVGGALAMLLELLESKDPENSKSAQMILATSLIIENRDVGQLAEHLLPHLLEVILSKLRMNERAPDAAIYNLQQLVIPLARAKYQPSPKVAQQISEIIELSTPAGANGILKTVLERLEPD